MWSILIISGYFPRLDYYFCNGFLWLAHHKKNWNFGDSPHKKIFTPNTKTKFEHLPNHDLLFCLVEMNHDAGSCKMFINYLETGLNTQWPSNITKSSKMNHLDWWIWQHRLHNWTNVEFVIWQKSKMNLAWWFGKEDLWHK